MGKNPENFAPKKFSEFVGQKQAKKIAEIVVSAAKIEKRPLPNLMIDGEYGLGKTTLAQVILNEMGQTPHIYDAQAVNLEIPSVKGTFIIDEIHNLNAVTADSLSIEIDRGKVSIIGCTTNPGLVPQAFRSRFRTIHLERYTEEDLTQILDAYALKKRHNIPRPVLAKLAKRARSNARIAISYLDFALDILVAEGYKKVDNKVVETAFGLLGVDDLGLTVRDYQYLLAFPNDGRAVGIQFLSAKLGIDEETIQREIEPYLMQMGWVDRTQRGRIRMHIGEIKNA